MPHQAKTVFSRPCLPVLLLLCSARLAHAHDPGLSTATVTLGTNKLEATLVFSIVDTYELVEVDKNRDGQISKEELEQAITKLRKTANEALDVKLNGQLVLPNETRCHFDSNNNATVELSFPLQSFTNLVIRSKWLTLLQPGHRQLFTLLTPRGEVLAERMLSVNSDSIFLDLDASEQKPDTRTHTFADFLLLGVKHIWTGYDHLLFLFGLLIVTRNFASSLKIITCFTIAHSITLAVATLSIVQISSRIVEPLIAASIVYVGLENLFRGDDPKGRWLLTFAFGLIHGFGFASVLRELGVGENGSGITVPLVSFNLGVELGQVVVAGLALPAIWKLRARPIFIARWVPACSLAVALLGGFWFVQRVWFGV
jgi:hydrogenase/urease accessory protein HupE